MKITLHEMTPDGMQKLKDLLTRPEHSRIQVKGLERDGELQLPISLLISDSQAIMAGDIVLVLAEHCTKMITFGD